MLSIYHVTKTTRPKGIAILWVRATEKLVIILPSLVAMGTVVVEIMFLVCQVILQDHLTKG